MNQEEIIQTALQRLLEKGKKGRAFVIFRVNDKREDYIQFSLSKTKAIELFYSGFAEATNGEVNLEEVEKIKDLLTKQSFKTLPAEKVKDLNEKQLALCDTPEGKELYANFGQNVKDTAITAVKILSEVFRIDKNCGIEPELELEG